MDRHAALRLTAASLLLAGLAGCATPATKVERQLIRVGMAPDHAECLGEEITDRLDKERTKLFLAYLDRLDRARTPGEALDALTSVENPSSAATIAVASSVCLVRGVGRQRD